MSIPLPPPVRKNPVTTVPPKKFEVTSGVIRAAFKLGIYGPEGIGKSSLAALCPGVAFADIEGSTKHLDVARVGGIESWPDLRAWVQSLNGGIVAIDSMTRAEDWAAAHVIATKADSNGVKAKDSIEDFKFNSGAAFVIDEFKKLLSDIDAAVRRGTSFILVAHNRINRFKDPDGSDFIRYEPRLLDTERKGSNMLQFVQFLDHLIFIDLDKVVDARGKVKGSGSRTIYLDTCPSRLSKARGIPNSPIPFPEGDTTLWKLLGTVTE